MLEFVAFIQAHETLTEFVQRREGPADEVLLARALAVELKPFDRSAARSRELEFQIFIQDRHPYDVRV